MRLQIRFYPLYNKNLIISLFQRGQTPLGVIKSQKSVDPEKKKFTCAYCGDKFPDKSTRIMHERATHVNSEMNLMEITCKICQEILPSSVHFRRHAIDKVDLIEKLKSQIMGGNYYCFVILQFRYCYFFLRISMFLTLKK